MTSTPHILREAIIGKPSKGTSRNARKSKAISSSRGETVRRLIVVLSAAALMLLALGTPSASADVHGVSQAGCAAPGAPSGATTEASQDAPGRPDAPIPRNASDGRTQGKGGDAPAQSTNC
jgi:hypothetical protein